MDLEEEKDFKIMKKIIIAFLFAVSFFAVAEAMVIAKRGGVSEVKIVIPQNPSKVVEYAAKEFKTFTKRMTGVDLEIVSDAQEKPQKAVLIGLSRHSSKKPEGVEDSFRILSSGETLEIVADGRGALYGVYEVLERFGGCEWFAPGVETIPSLEIFEVPDKTDISETPAFELRETDWRHLIKDHAFAARLRFNGQWHSKALFGGTSLKFAKGTGWCHTFWRIVPPKKYFAEHPEWFSLVNGKRVGENAQICWSNPEVTAHVIEEAKRLLRADPAAKIIGISQNDCGNYCTCNECQKCTEEEGSPAGPNLRFVNRVAEAIEKEFPDVLVETLAYQFTRKPPKNIRPRRNVAVCLCSFECVFATPFEESWDADTKRFADDVRSWGAICENLLIYNYAVNFRNYLFPFPNVPTMAANYKLFKSNGARWVYDQADSNAYGADFAELKAYVQSKLMWNPKREVAPLVDKFMTAFYGAGAPYVKEYFNKCNELLKHPSKEDALGDTDAYPMSTGIYGENLPQLSEEFLDEAIELWRKAAEAVKGDKEREINVATGALAPRYIRLKRLYERDFKSVWLTENPAAFLARMEKLKPLAADFVSRLDALRKHKRGVSLSEGYKRSQKMCADFKALSIKPIEPKSADKVFISTNVLARVHGAWQFPLREIACDEGVKYRLRVKARLKRGSTSSAGFSAGLNVPWLPHAPGQFKREISDLTEEWQWREVGVFDFAALQKHPLPTMDGLVVYASRGADIEGFEIERLMPPVAPLDSEAWGESEWISAVDQKVYEKGAFSGVRAAEGVSWFYHSFTNSGSIKSARFMTTALGVYDVYVNGVRVGNDFLKPGFTHCRKTRYSFTYDVTELLKKAHGDVNVLAAEVGAGWWRDKIVTPNGHRGFIGRKSAFRGVLEIVYADGTRKLVGTKASAWRSGMCGRIRGSSIFDGEWYDERRKEGVNVDFNRLKESEVNDEFKGKIVPTDGAEVVLRRDLTLNMKEAYVWKGVTGKTTNEFGRVRVLRRYSPGEEMTVKSGETLVVDFAQNAAAVPEFEFAAKKDVRVVVKPAEMLNDGNGEKSRGNDGPQGSVYRANLREAAGSGCRAVYTFGGGGENHFRKYHPKFTFYGYRYISVTATGTLKIRSVTSIPVTSITKEMESGSIVTGVPELNRFIENVKWSQYSNYLSIPSDCPQRNERLGWTADTQIFARTGAYNADTYDFMRKWMRDMRDSQHKSGAFPSVAPYAQYGNEGRRFGWGDAGIIVPYEMWRHFGDKRIIEENWAAMTAYSRMQKKTGFRFGRGDMQYADWLSFEKYESYGRKCFVKDKSGKRKVSDEALAYWNYLAGCYWILDSEMMSEMALAIGREDEARLYAKTAQDVRLKIRGEFFSSGDGMILESLRDMQTPALFALKCRLVEGDAKEKTIEALKNNFAARGNRMSTGFLGTSVLLDTLSDNGLEELAYTILLGHGFPGWLYSVDQGATTIWERWNSYTHEKGFGPVGMNSFNHYAYGSVVGWLYHTAAGIASDPANPGFKNVIMRPKFDRRLGFVKAEYRSRFGVIKSEWRYVNGKWVWSFTIPEGATADVTLPGGKDSRRYTPGCYTLHE